MLDIQVITSGQIGLVNLPKNFDFKDKNVLKERVPEWVKAFQLTLLVFNFTDTVFVGSSGVYPFFQFLGEQNLKCARRKVRFAIVGLSSEYERLLEGMGIKNKFLLYPNGDSFAHEALESLRLSKQEAKAILEAM